MLGLRSSNEMHSGSFSDYKRTYHLIGEITTECALKHPNVQRFLHQTSSSQRYDLILVEQYYQDAFLMLGHQFQAPIVSICEFQ